MSTRSITLMFCWSKNSSRPLLGPASKTTVLRASSRTAQLPWPTSRTVRDGPDGAMSILPIFEEQFLVAVRTEVYLSVQSTARPKLVQKFGWHDLGR